MVAYLAVYEREGPDDAAPLDASLWAGDWVLAVEARPWRIFTRGPIHPQVRKLPCGRGYVVGDLFRRRSSSPVGAEIDSVVFSQRLSNDALAAELCANYWGRYVALISPSEGAAAGGVFRDPSGAVDALMWRSEQRTVVASHLPVGLDQAYQPDLSFDWSSIGTWLRTGAAVACRSGLQGVTSVFAGAAHWFEVGAVQHWRPADFCRPWRSADRAITDLPQELDRCVAMLAQPSVGLRAEISGGLDSAILASSLVSSSRDKVRAWENIYEAEGPGDERVYAREVAALNGVALTEISAEPFLIDPERLSETAGGLRPAFSAFDIAGDAAAAARNVALGVDRVMTGQGGDMVFFQMPTPALAADLLARRPIRAWRSGEMVELARWTRHSVWSLLAVAVCARRRQPGELLLNDHPWLEGAAGLPPAKRIQLASLAQKLTIHIENRQTRTAEVVHPLLSQPVVEACLSISAADLAQGGRDRALARAAFASRLPPAVRDRRGKGEMSGYYGRVLGDSLAAVRSYLLDGRLAAEGLLDRARMEAMLTREQLIWSGGVFPILTALTVEAWVRHWSARAASS